NVGRENMAGSGEWPSPDTPPTGPAPGPSEVPDRSRGPTQFKDALERDPVLGGSSTAGDPG
ncbi:MAG: hypothetical protein QOI20_2704, partial [Acidimicrobiaceae bacterium]|nr:hypothetical protein [Acidimicrobiaceae bacterium]